MGDPLLSVENGRKLSWWSCHFRLQLICTKSEALGACQCQLLPLWLQLFCTAESEASNQPPVPLGGCSLINSKSITSSHSSKTHRPNHLSLLALFIKVILVEWVAQDAASDHHDFIIHVYHVVDAWSSNSECKLGFVN